MRLLTPQSRRLLHGMRGVSRLYLARPESDPVPLLAAARDDLLETEGLGEDSDRSVEHFDVLAQILVRLHDSTGEPGHLDEARAAVRRAHALGHDSVSLTVDLADVALRGGLRAHTTSVEGDGVALRAAWFAFTAAALLYDRAHGRCEEPSTRRVLAAHRGQAVARLSGTLRLLGLPFTEHLDRAIADLRVCAEPDGPYHGVALTGALLARTARAPEEGLRPG